MRRHYGGAGGLTWVLARSVVRRLEVIDWLVVAGTGRSVGGVILVILGATR